MRKTSTRDCLAAPMVPCVHAKLCHNSVFALPVPSVARKSPSGSLHVCFGAVPSPAPQPQFYGEAFPQTTHRASQEGVHNRPPVMAEERRAIHRAQMQRYVHTSPTFGPVFRSPEHDFAAKTFLMQLSPVIAGMATRITWTRSLPLSMTNMASCFPIWPRCSRWALPSGSRHAKLYVLVFSTVFLKITVTLLARHRQPRVLKFFGSYRYEFDHLDYPGTIRWGLWATKFATTPSLIIHLANDGSSYRG